MITFKTLAMKTAMLAALAAPLAMTACDARDAHDAAIAIGVVGTSVAATALEDATYAPYCYSYDYDYYCDDSWDGWYGRPWYDSGNVWWDMKVPHGTVGPKAHSHLATAEVVGGGLHLRFGVSRGASIALGRAFMAARSGDLSALRRIGFTDEDVTTIADMRPLAPQRVRALAQRLGTSPASLANMISGLQAEYQRTH